MKPKKKVYVVAHSHWDREWYFTIEDSNILLSENMPYLMNVLENDSEYTSYTFDAQLSIVEEFIKLYPEEKERLQKLISDKKMFVGPWYTQTDSLLVNTESIVRNLLYGTRLGQEYGHSMKVGYLPDIFGQNAYLPSIFKGFDIKDSVLQRGVYTDELKQNLNFNWTSPDGEVVNANNIFLGYGPGKFLASGDEYLYEKLIPMLEKLEELNKDCNNLLLPAGGDQVLVRTQFPTVIKELNEKQDKYEFILSDYETFMNDTRQAPFENEIHGELIACQKSRIHNTIKSQRYDIKYLNTKVENKILYVLEPLNVIANTLGITYKTRWLDIMWKLLFDAHAHDSIGGCNSDDTNKDIVTRLEKVNVMCDGLINIIKKQLTIAISKKLNRDDILVVFNTNSKPVTDVMTATIFTNSKDFNLTTLENQNVTFSLVKQDVISGGKKVVVTAEGEKEVELPGYYRSEILMDGLTIAPMGFNTFVVTENTTQAADALETVTDKSIENELYELFVTETNISLSNKQTGEAINELFYFENCADFGDSYDFSPLDNDQPIEIVASELLEVSKNNLTQTMTLKHTVALPADLEERQENKTSSTLEIITTFELRKNEKYVRVAHEIENNVNDHRLRIVFNTNIVSKTSFAHQGYSAIERVNESKYLANWKEEKFAEKPVSIYALEHFVAMQNEKTTFSLITKGIKEYEVLEDTKLALTLYRSVGLLGRDDLAWRPGRASGINNKVVYTPDAQMHQTLNFEYAIYFNQANSSFTEVFEATDQFLAKYTTYQKQDLNLFEERLERFEIPTNLELNVSEYSLFSLDNHNVYMSVCKKAYDGTGMIVRLFNPSNDVQTVTLSSDIIKEVKLTNLYEAELASVDKQIEVPRKGYVTLKLLGV